MSCKDVHDFGGLPPARHFSTFVPSLSVQRGRFWPKVPWSVRRWRTRACTGGGRRLADLATELSKAVALEGMQVLGGYGYATEYEMEAHLRATVVSTVYGGTSEVQRDIIGKTCGR